MDDVGKIVRGRQAEGIAIVKQIPGRHPGREHLLDSAQIREVRNVAA